MIVWLVVSAAIVALIPALPELKERIEQSRNERARRNRAAQRATARRLRKEVQRQREADRRNRKALDRQQAAQRKAQEKQDRRHRDWVIANPAMAVQQLALRFIPQEQELLRQAAGARRAARRAAAAAKRARRRATALERSLPRWLTKPGAGRTAVLLSMPLLGAAAMANGVLDFEIFRHIYGNVIVAIILAPLTVGAIGSFSFLLGVGIGLHRERAARGTVRRRVPVPAGMRNRRTAFAFGLVATVGALAWLFTIAPNRSAEQHQQAVNAAQTTLRITQSQFAAHEGTQAGVDAAMRQSQDATHAMNVAARNDQASVIVAAALELLLVEAAMMASPLRDLARMRRGATALEDAADQAKQVARAADAAPKAARARFGSDAFDYLVRQGVIDAQQAVLDGIARARMGSDVAERAFTADLPKPVRGPASTSSSSSADADDDPGALVGALDDHLDDDIDDLDATDRTDDTEPSDVQTVEDAVPPVPGIDDLDVAS